METVAVVLNVAQHRTEEFGGETVVQLDEA